MPETFLPGPSATPQTRSTRLLGLAKAVLDPEQRSKARERQADLCR
jgi:hypothetical protein